MIRLLAVAAMATGIHLAVWGSASADPGYYYGAPWSNGPYVGPHPGYVPPPVYYGPGPVAPGYGGYYAPVPRHRYRHWHGPATPYFVPRYSGGPFGRVPDYHSPNYGRRHRHRHFRD